jgi:hypothetical protein
MLRQTAWSLAFLVAMLIAADAEGEALEEGRLLAATLSQCKVDIEVWRKALDAAKAVHDGKPASLALDCRDELIDRADLAERLRWYGFDREAARADWQEVRQNFGLKVFMEGVSAARGTGPGSEISLTREDIELANMMLVVAAQLQALLDTVE